MSLSKLKKSMTSLFLFVLIMLLSSFFLFLSCGDDPGVEESSISVPPVSEPAIDMPVVSARSPQFTVTSVEDGSVITSGDEVTIASDEFSSPLTATSKILVEDQIVKLVLDDATVVNLFNIEVTDDTNSVDDGTLAFSVEAINGLPHGSGVPLASAIDNNTGIVKIILVAIDSDSNVTRFILNLKVTDSTAPVISLADSYGNPIADGSTLSLSIHALQSAEYPVIVTAQDNLEGDLSASVSIDGGGLDLSNIQVGSYVITATVTDGSDNSASISITLVLDNDVTPISGSISYPASSYTVSNVAVNLVLTSSITPPTAVVNYQIDPALENGLALGSDGSITGTLSGIYSKTVSYTVTAAPVNISLHGPDTVQTTLSLSYLNLPIIEHNAFLTTSDTTIFILTNSGNVDASNIKVKIVNAVIAGGAVNGVGDAQNTLPLFGAGTHTFWLVVHDQHAKGINVEMVVDEDFESIAIKIVKTKHKLNGVVAAFYGDVDTDWETELPSDNIIATSAGAGGYGIQSIDIQLVIE